MSANYKGDVRCGLDRWQFQLPATRFG